MALSSPEAFRRVRYHAQWRNTRLAMPSMASHPHDSLKTHFLLVCDDWTKVQWSPVAAAHTLHGVMKKPRPVVAVVDDEEAIRKALKRLLRSAGIAVESYASGQEFLESLPAQHPQCVVLDIGMQGMTGFDVQAQLKAARMAVPVIFITALMIQVTRRARCRPAHLRSCENPSTTKRCSQRSAQLSSEPRRHLANDRSATRSRWPKVQ